MAAWGLSDPYRSLGIAPYSKWQHGGSQIPLLVAPSAEGATSLGIAPYRSLGIAPYRSLGIATEALG